MSNLYSSPHRQIELWVDFFRNRCVHLVPYSLRVADLPSKLEILEQP